jgi:hypothetical protein
MRRFEQRNCIGRPAQSKQRKSAELRRLFIMGILFQGTRECSVCFNELVLRVQSETAQSIDASGWRLPGGQRIELLQGIRGMTAINHQAQLDQIR